MVRPDNFYCTFSFRERIVNPREGENQKVFRKDTGVQPVSFLRKRLPRRAIALLAVSIFICFQYFMEIANAVTRSILTVRRNGLPRRAVALLADSILFFYAV